MFLILIFLVIASFLFFIYRLSTSKFDYWKKQNVPHLKPTPLIGNYGDLILLRKFIGQVTSDICKQFPREPYVGAFFGTEPTLIVQDPEIIKLVTTKDFYYFNGREANDYAHREVATRNLFFSGGDEWKVFRQNLTPLFSTAKMKNMFHLIQKCAVVFEKKLDEEVNNSKTVEIRDLMSRYTMACICSAAFGVEADTLARDYKSNPFFTIGNLIFEPSTARGLTNITRAVWPAIFYAIGLKNFPESLNLFFKKFLTGVFEGRQYKPTTRNDFIDLILTLKQKNYIVGDSFSSKKTGIDKKVEIPVTDELLISQCMLFFAAGYETSSTTLSYVLYELAKNVDAQKKALEEVDRYLAKHGNKVDFDCVTELPYVESCVDETLRLYPLLAVLTRELVEDYTFPDGLKLHKGVRVHIPTYHMHHNPDHFPEPEKYLPERFSAENKKSIKPHTYFPFGDGSRICIGLRFAKMQMLAGLVTLLKKYSLELAEETPMKLQFNPRCIVTSSTCPILVKLVARDGWEKRTFTFDK